ncbi:hypothetical protein SmJEL517_g03890 [Synchytrium microbalum]|uniref:5'-Nucleotidase C-terminal domain-containing protein n=1 Tax=Synchytrium microbalum TaxID=1806994 RepID=A0A507C1G5_9FUNG|nr:uncharacterized protein SmJEL517_g03890 [Synchytrium microbalum]TPX33208.1 hypothetical protein SmJEL517_g03890 [Synchytrium microbalum]
MLVLVVILGSLPPLRPSEGDYLQFYITYLDRGAAGLNTILFDAGDQFQGTLFFNVWGSSIISQTMNMLGYEVMTVGNHEFDRGEEYAANFFKTLNFPVVSSNFNYSTAPYLSQIVQPYVIIEKYGQKIGVVGFITNTTADITLGGKNITFYNPVASVQNSINAIRAAGVKKIIGVSHNGYFDDQYLAANTEGLSLIVGGHSHSLLSKNTSLPGWVGLYPTSVTNLNGSQTYVVQAHRYGDYFGVVNMTWDSNDQLIDLKGDPILLDNTISPDAGMAELVTTWRAAFVNLTTQVVADVNPPGYTTDNCRTTECAEGDMICDAMLMSRRLVGAQVCMNNGGSVRAGLGPGNVTVGDIMEVLPFSNVVVDTNMTGNQIRMILEGAISGKNLVTKKNVITVPQVAGIRFNVDRTRPQGQQAVNITIQDPYPAETYSPINLNQTYIVVVNDFLCSGGDNILLDVITNYIAGDLLTDAVSNYLQSRNRTIDPVTDGRAYQNVTAPITASSLLVFETV